MEEIKGHSVIRLLMTVALVVAACVCAASQGGDAGYSFGAADKNDPCLSCHGDAQIVKASSFIDQRLYAHTTHSSIGCVSCHGGVTASHPDGGKMPRAECGECHSDINDEYAGSIHAGKTRCAGCHNPHKVESPSEISGHQINQMCSSCHDGLEMIALHGEWLPQADLHVTMLPCITCHTESKSYFISMYIVKGENGSRFGRQQVAGYEELKKMAAGRPILSLIDSNGDNYVSLAELRNFNRNKAHALHLQGMMTPETVTHNFEILDSRRNCVFCHASGPAAMQTSFLTLPEENGTFRRVAVEKGAVFDALYGTPDFYLMGSTKSTTLNYVGLAIICGGLILPVGHGSLRFLTRKNRKGKEQKS